MKVFRRDDAGYIRWLKDNPTGYVLNCRREKGVFRLHRANCVYTNSKPTRGATATTKYMKLCSEDMASIEKWARYEISYCPVCLRERLLPERKRKARDWIMKDDQLFLFDRKTVRLFRVAGDGERVEITNMDDVAHILVWGHSIAVEKARIILEGRCRQSSLQHTSEVGDK